MIGFTMPDFFSGRLEHLPEDEDIKRVAEDVAKYHGLKLTGVYTSTSSKGDKGLFIDDSRNYLNVKLTFKDHCDIDAVISIDLPVSNKMIREEIESKFLRKL